jgi:non-homologous end joining protein Ku
MSIGTKLEELIQDKIEHGDKPVPRTSGKKQPSKVIDLVSVLKKSIEETGGHSKAASQKAAKRKHESGAASRRSGKKAA